MAQCQIEAHIAQAAQPGSLPGLDRTRELLRRMGNPERQLKFVHIAGTNGKGSTAALMESVLRHAGHRTGLFTSPHLERFHERIRIDGLPVADAQLARSAERVLGLAGGMGARPTEFELITCIAKDCFAACGCYLVVLETGLGGRLDATNVIPPPEAAILTAISLDHTRELGNTLTQITREKAGILKPGCVAVCYPSVSEARRVVEAVCRTRQIPLRTADCSKLVCRADTLDGQVFDYGPWRGLHIRLLGGHQRCNTAVMLETVTALRESGWSIPDAAVYAGAASAQWPGRFEVLRRAPVFVADGGHNPQCAQALAEGLRHYFPGKRIHFLVGMMADKDHNAALSVLAPLAADFYTVTPDNPRAVDAGKLVRELRAMGKPAAACPTVAQGVETCLRAAGAGDVVCSFGSLYMTGEIRSHVLKST